MNMTPGQRGACHAIIHSASASAGAVGAGLAQLPCSDNAVIVPIQTAMAVSLGKVFGLSLTEGAAGAAVVTALGTTVGRGASQLLVGWIPVAGNIVNACTAASLTEALGWTLASEFAAQAA